MNSEDLQAIIHRQAGLSRVADTLGNLIQPSIRLHASLATEDSLNVGSSKIGGLPDLPAGSEWPKWKHKPLSFIAQLHMRELAPFDVRRALPESGILYFFYDSDAQPWGFDPADRGGWRVRHHSGDVSRLIRTSPPHEMPAQTFGPCSVTPSSEATLPSADSLAVQGLQLSRDERDSYWDLLITFENQEGPSLIHRALGHPDEVQGEMQVECQLASSGLYVGDASGYEHPLAEALKRNAPEWRLLLQIDSQEDAGMMWGDAGRIYYWIRDADLRRRDFASAWLVLQCG